MNAAHCLVLPRPMSSAMIPPMVILQTLHPRPPVMLVWNEAAVLVLVEFDNRPYSGLRWWRVAEGCESVT
jgi:hypothetical protein